MFSGTAQLQLAFSSDWFIALFLSLVVGQSDHFGFTTLIVKTALWKHGYDSYRTQFGLRPLPVLQNQLLFWENSKVSTV